MKQLIYIMIIASFVGCELFYKKWPSDAYQQLAHSEGIVMDCRFIDAISNNTQNSTQYIYNLLSAYKNEFPNYRDFEKATLSNNRVLDNIRIKEIKRIASSYDLDVIWELIANNSQEAQSLKNEYSVLYNDLANNVKADLKKEFRSLSTFIERLNDNSTSNIIEHITSRYIRQINIKIEEQQRLTEKQRQAQIQYLNSLYELLTYKSFWTGDFIVKNKSSNSIYVNLAFYFYGNEWEGWTTCGFSLIPGQSKTIDIPLNSNGHLNRYIYYCAKTYDANYWGWRGDRSFITLNVQDEYFLPCANDWNLLSKCNLITDVQANANFKQKDIGENQTTYTLTLTD